MSPAKKLAISSMLLAFTGGIAHGLSK